MSKQAIRNALRSAFGDRQYRITKSGEIHVYGDMPNTNMTGWYLFGYLDDDETEGRIESL